MWEQLSTKKALYPKAHQNPPPPHTHTYTYHWNTPHQLAAHPAHKTCHTMWDGPTPPMCCPRKSRRCQGTRACGRVQTHSQPAGPGTQGSTGFQAVELLETWWNVDAGCLACISTHTQRERGGFLGANKNLWLPIVGGPAANRRWLTVNPTVHKVRGKLIGGGWHDKCLCCCLQLAAPVGLSPLTAALPLNPFAPQAAAPIDLSTPCALPPPAWPILTPLHPFLSLGRLCQRIPRTVPASVLWTRP